jgi:hypothetical protein
MPTDKPILKDSESISIAKELQNMLEKHKKSKSALLKSTNDKGKKINKSKHNESKKVIVSHQTSKQREYQSK